MPRSEGPRWAVVRFVFFVFFGGLKFCYFRVKTLSSPTRRTNTGMIRYEQHPLLEGLIAQYADGNGQQVGEGDGPPARILRCRTGKDRAARGFWRGAVCRSGEVPEGTGVAAIGGLCDGALEEWVLFVLDHTGGYGVVDVSSKGGADMLAKWVSSVNSSRMDRIRHLMRKCIPNSSRCTARQAQQTLLHGPCPT